MLFKCKQNHCECFHLYLYENLSYNFGIPWYSLGIFTKLLFNLNLTSHSKMKRTAAIPKETKRSKNIPITFSMPRASRPSPRQFYKQNYFMFNDYFYYLCWFDFIFRPNIVDHSRFYHLFDAEGFNGRDYLVYI